MSHSSTGGRAMRRCVDSSLPSKDKAAALFDSVFANQPKPSTSLNRSDCQRPSGFTSLKCDQTQSKKGASNLPCAPFHSSTVAIPHFAESSKSDMDASNGDKIIGRRSSTHLPSVAISQSTSFIKKSIGSEGIREKTETFVSESKSKRTDIFSFEMEEEEDNDDAKDTNKMGPQAKRLKPEEECIGAQEVKNSGSSHALAVKASYRHKWLLDDDEDKDDFASHVKRKDADNDASVAIIQNTVSNVSNQAERSALGRIWIPDVKEAHECLKSGEEDDFVQDVNYIFGTLLDPSSSNKLKCLSVITLLKKCVSSEFRGFFRSNNLLNRTLKAIPDLSKIPGLALCISAVVYLLSRDSTSVFVDEPSLRLFSQLLKMEQQNLPVESIGYPKLIMDTLKDWLNKSFSNVDAIKVQFDITEETLTPSFLILESLVYICARKHREHLVQNELLNVGILQWIVYKIDKMVLRLSYEKISEKEMLLCLKVLERCFRVLESATVCNEKNGAYLISHRGSSLVHSCGRLIVLLYHGLERLGDSADELKEQNITCLNRMVGVLMSLSYENETEIAELCSSKLGQINDFLLLCVSCFTCLVPKYVRKEKQFDLIVMLCSLLVNLLERCNSNRRKVIALTVPVYDSVCQIEKQEPTLKALSQLFAHHESLARSIDEELDNDLVIEDAPTDDTDEGAREDAVSDGRLHRLPAELSEDEMVETVQNAMNKASTHMEDSVLASYFALLIGCLLLQNEEWVDTVKTEMKNGKLIPLIEQLQRFLDFIKLTDGKKSHVRFMERIIDLLDTLDN
ncbi:unnamed protein product [Thelazia callipaeda]|uniref:WAPL domain-containing protein n=1 Tax=Thelazia callipaeda TaxID=103827 RepID=A0A0N5CQN1_THECL|nr:unnamed protein product [Thelazia callipaeda]